MFALSSFSVVEGQGEGGGGSSPSESHTLHYLSPSSSVGLPSPTRRHTSPVANPNYLSSYLLIEVPSE